MLPSVQEFVSNIDIVKRFNQDNPQYGDALVSALRSSDGSKRSLYEIKRADQEFRDGLMHYANIVRTDIIKREMDEHAKRVAAASQEQLVALINNLFPQAEEKSRPITSDPELAKQFYLATNPDTSGSRNMSIDYPYLFQLSQYCDAAAPTLTEGTEGTEGTLGCPTGCRQIEDKCFASVSPVVQGMIDRDLLYLIESRKAQASPRRIDTGRYSVVID
jgi:hypothetical protein